jgi:hypothetical protein
MVIGNGQRRAALSRLQAGLSDGDTIVFSSDCEIVTLTIATRPVFRGGRTWLVKPNGAEAVAASPDQKLINSLAQAHIALSEHGAAPTQTADQLRGAKAIADSYLRRLTALAFLAPDIQRAIVDGRMPAGLSARQIMAQDLPLAWADQRSLLGLAR